MDLVVGLPNVDGSHIGLESGIRSIMIFMVGSSATRERGEYCK